MKTTNRILGANQIKDYDNYRTYSVIDESGNTDLYNGTYNQCLDYIKRLGWIREGNPCMICLISVEGGLVGLVEDETIVVDNDGNYCL